MSPDCYFYTYSLNNNRVLITKDKHKYKVQKFSYCILRNVV